LFILGSKGRLSFVINLYFPLDYVQSLHVILLLMSANSIQAKNNEKSAVDTMHINLDRNITVSGTCLSRSVVDFPFEKNRFADVLKIEGFGIVKKGSFLAQDICVDGFKRGDIEMVIDGERFYCACPNRMDNPLSRTNSLEMETITLNKTTESAQAGIGGIISFNREQSKDTNSSQSWIVTSLSFH